MNVKISKQNSSVVQPTQAIIIFSAGDASMANHTKRRVAMLCDVKDGRIMPGEPLAPEAAKQFIVELSNANVKKADSTWNFPNPEILAYCDKGLAFFVPASVQQMFYKPDKIEKSDELVEQLNGKWFSNPPLLFVCKAGSIDIFALGKNQKPELSDKVYQTPYWNVNDQGHLCTGNAPFPMVCTAANMKQFVTVFFESKFTHANGRTLQASMPFLKFWKKYQGKRLRKVLVKDLLPQKQTVLDVINAA